VAPEFGARPQMTLTVKLHKDMAVDVLLMETQEIAKYNEGDQGISICRTQMHLKKVLL
jgi:hypothetical protein